MAEGIYKLALISYAALLMILLLSGIAGAQYTSYTSSSSASTSVASTTTIPPNATILSYSSKAMIIKVAKGANVVVILNSTYWSFNGSSNTSVAKQVGNTTYTQVTGSSPGLGEGNASATFTAVAAGFANITASRTSCGEALECTGGNGIYYVSIVVFANLQSSSTTSTTVITTTAPSTTICIHTAGAICTNTTTAQTTTLCPSNADCAPLTTVPSSSVNVNSTIPNCTTCPSGFNASGDYCRPICKPNGPCPQLILDCPKNTTTSTSTATTTLCPANAICTTVTSTAGSIASTSPSTLYTTSASTTITQSSGSISSIISSIINWFKSLFKF